MSLKILYSDRSIYTINVVHFVSLPIGFCEFVKFPQDPQIAFNPTTVVPFTVNNMYRTSCYSVCYTQYHQQVYTNDT